MYLLISVSTGYYKAFAIFFLFSCDSLTDVCSPECCLNVLMVSRIRLLLYLPRVFFPDIAIAKNTKGTQHDGRW